MKTPGPLLLALLVASGCAPTLSTFQPAHVAPRGHVTAEAGLDVSAPVGTISRSFDAAETLGKAAQSRTLNDDERRQLIETGANIALDPPAIVTHVAATYVPFTGWELGGRLMSGGWRAGVRHQFVDQATRGFDLSAGVGVSRFTYEFPIDKVVDVLKLDDFDRWSVDVPLLIGKHGSWYRVWAGPRLLASTFSTALQLQLPATGSTPAETEVASVNGHATYLGGQAGFALGYRWLFVGFELTVADLISGAHLDLAGQRQNVDLGGVVIYPGVAIMGEL